MQRVSGQQLFNLDAVWVDDSTTDVCMNRLCKRKFTLLNGKHHCRWCGLIFCDLCAPRTTPWPPGSGGQKKYRRCNSCRLPIIFRSYVASQGSRRQAVPISIILSFLDNRSIHQLQQSCVTTLSEFHVPDFPYYESVQQRYPTFFDGAQIGKGGSGTVYKCEDRQLPGSPRVALKVITKANVYTYAAWRKILTELSILRDIHHENVAQLLDVFQTKTTLVIVMEAGEGGALRQAWEFARKHHYDMEVFTAHVISQVSEGLDYLFREKHIIHRDIKHDNIVLSRDYGKVMIIDFGLAEYVDPEVRQRFVPCGTMGFASPENILAVVERRHLFEASGDTMHRADMFSLGVVAFMMLSAQKPLRGKRFTDLYTEVKKGLRCSGPRWADISSDAKTLIEMLLETKTRARATPRDVRVHPYIVQKAPLIVDISHNRVHELSVAEQAEGDEWVYVNHSDDWNVAAEEDFLTVPQRNALVRRLSPLRLMK